MLENLKKKAKDSGLNSTNLTIIGVTMLATGAYLMHRGHLRIVTDELTEQWQAVRDETMWSSFDEGVRYGLVLAKDAAEFGGTVAKEGSKYAFAAFDKPA